MGRSLAAQAPVSQPAVAKVGPAADFSVTDRLVDVKFRFDKAKREAEIRDFRFHDLRHTAATRMADGGADAFALAEIFGWSDVRMALRYTHATDESKRRAVENLAKPIGPSDESVTNEKGRVAALP
jgi:integrase